MRRFTFAAAALLAALAAAPAAGQTGQIQDDVERKLAKARAAARTEEHIEILRRLLDRQLAESADLATTSPDQCPAIGNRNIDLGYSYNSPTHSFLRPTEGGDGGVRIWDSGDKRAPGLGMMRKYDVHRLQPPPLSEGVSLPGQGVVFTVTLPTPSRDPMAVAEKPADRPLTAWERERRELRGDKPETPKKAEAGSPSVSETILRLLAENGKHFTELSPDEHVTVAVVFRPGRWFTNQQCASCHHGTARTLFNSWLEGSSAPGASSSDPNRPIPRPMGPPSTPALKKADDTIAAQFRNDMALGELHVKQGKLAEAVKLYQGLIEKCDALLTELGKQPADTSGPERLQVVVIGTEICSRLAQAHLAMGDRDSALRVLQKGTGYGRNLEGVGAAPKTGTEPAPASPLPAKLVISVSKRILDQAGTGKMSLGDFRKQATITYTGAEKEKETKP
jgi:hypothetical protein